MGVRLKDARGIAHAMERYWVGGLDWEKNKQIPGAQLKDVKVTSL